MSYCEVEVKVYAINTSEQEGIFCLGAVVDCPVEAEDRGEYWGVPCAEDVVDITRAENERNDLEKMLDEEGAYIVATEIDGEMSWEMTKDEIREVLQMPQLTDAEVVDMLNNAEEID